MHHFASTGATLHSTTRCFQGPEYANEQLRYHNHVIPLETHIQKNYNTPLEHTPGNPPTQLWKDSLYNLLVKV